MTKKKKSLIPKSDHKPTWAARTEPEPSSAQKQPWLTCIWSCEEGRSGCGGTGSPSAGMSHPLEWHSWCRGNLRPFPEHMMWLHWHPCPRSSVQSLAKWGKERRNDVEIFYCKHEKKKEGMRKNLPEKVRLWGGGLGGGGGRAGGRGRGREILIPWRMCHV